MTESKILEKSNIDVSKCMDMAEEKQREFESQSKVRVRDECEDRGEGEGRALERARGWQVLRDCMLAMRIAIIKNKKFFSSKTRYRLAWLMQECGKYVDVDNEAVSGHVVKLLDPIFFNPDKNELLTGALIEQRFSNYYEPPCFNNLNAFMRNKIKLIKLFLTHLYHLRAHKSDEVSALDPLDRIEKLLEFMMRDEEKRIGSEPGKAPSQAGATGKSFNPHSLKAAIVHAVKLLFDVMQEKALDEKREAIEYAFRVAGKLRDLLKDRINSFPYLEVHVHPRLLLQCSGANAQNGSVQNASWWASSQAAAAASVKVREVVAQIGKYSADTLVLGEPLRLCITLEDKWCPLNSLLNVACRAYSTITQTPYYETSHNGNKHGCMSCAASRWKEVFGPKKLSLNPKGAMSAKSATMQTSAFFTPLTPQAYLTAGGSAAVAWQPVAIQQAMMMSVQASNTASASSAAGAALAAAPSVTSAVPQ